MRSHLKSGGPQIWVEKFSIGQIPTSKETEKAHLQMNQNLGLVVTRELI